MAHTTGLFKEGHLGDPIEVICQGTKYTIENIQFVKELPNNVRIYSLIQKKCFFPFHGYPYS